MVTEVGFAPNSFDSGAHTLNFLLYHIRYGMYHTQHSAWHMISIKMAVILIVYLCSPLDYELFEDKHTILLYIFTG